MVWRAEMMIIIQLGYTHIDWSALCDSSFDYGDEREANCVTKGSSVILRKQLNRYMVGLLDLV